MKEDEIITKLFPKFILLGRQYYAVLTSNRNSGDRDKLGTGGPMQIATINYSEPEGSRAGSLSCVPISHEGLLPWFNGQRWDYETLEEFRVLLVKFRSTLVIELERAIKNLGS